MRTHANLPPKSESRTCGACGLKSYAPVVIVCAKLKGETEGRVRCSNVLACARRVRLADRQAQRATATR